MQWCAVTVGYDRGALLAELDRLLDLGEPVLTLFPNRDPGDWGPQLPGSVSLEMGWYAGCAAMRVEYQKRRHNYRPLTTSLAEWAAELEVGLLGWRVIGVLEGTKQP